MLIKGASGINRVWRWIDITNSRHPFHWYIDGLVQGCNNVSNSDTAVFHKAMHMWWQLAGALFQNTFENAWLYQWNKYWTIYYVVYIAFMISFAGYAYTRSRSPWPHKSFGSAVKTRDERTIEITEQRWRNGNDNSFGPEKKVIVNGHTSNRKKKRYPFAMDWVLKSDIETVSFHWLNNISRVWGFKFSLGSVLTAKNTIWINTISEIWYKGMFLRGIPYVIWPLF